MNIKQLREELGWSQQRLAEELGTSRVTVARWEIGKSSPRSKKREDKLAKSKRRDKKS